MPKPSKPLKNMHLLCNAYWLDTSALQGCDLSKIREPTYGFNQNVDVVATLPPSPRDNFCASAKHNDSPNTLSIDSAALISSGSGCRLTPEESQDTSNRCWHIIAQRDGGNWRKGSSTYQCLSHQPIRNSYYWLVTERHTSQCAGHYDGQTGKRTYGCGPETTYYDMCDNNPNQLACGAPPGGCTTVADNLEGWANPHAPGGVEKRGWRCLYTSTEAFLKDQAENGRWSDKPSTQRDCGSCARCKSNGFLREGVECPD